MTTTLTISAPLAMAAVPTLLAIGGVVVGIALNGWLTTGIEVARLNAANDDKTARWLWLRGYRKTPHAGPDITPELPAADPHVTGELLAIDGVDTETDAPHEDTDRVGMWRVLLGLGSDLVDRVHDWLPGLLRQRAERDKVGSGEQAVDPAKPLREVLAASGYELDPPATNHGPDGQRHWNDVTAMHGIVTPGRHRKDVPVPAQRTGDEA